jgi:hypothetical protein
MDLLNELIIEIKTTLPMKWHVIVDWEFASVVLPSRKRRDDVGISRWKRRGRRPLGAKPQMAVPTHVTSPGDYSSWDIFSLLTSY